MTCLRHHFRPVLALCAALGVVGCASQRNAVVAATGTTIGVELGTQAGTNAPTGVLGYRRAEFAHVPATDASGAAASSVPNVVMELSYGGVFQSDGRIYQRLAIGTDAVNGGAAKAMFSRTANGDVQQAAIQLTATNADDVKVIMACVGRVGNTLSRASLDEVIAAADADNNTKAAIGGYRDQLKASSLTMSQLNTTVRTSDSLAAALAKHAQGDPCLKP